MSDENSMYDKYDDFELLFRWRKLYKIHMINSTYENTLSRSWRWFFFQILTMCDFWKKYKIVGSMNYTSCPTMVISFSFVCSHEKVASQNNTPEGPRVPFSVSFAVFQIFLFLFYA